MKKVLAILMGAMVAAASAAETNGPVTPPPGGNKNGLDRPPRPENGNGNGNGNGHGNGNGNGGLSDLLNGNRPIVQNFLTEKKEFLEAQRALKKGASGAVQEARQELRDELKAQRLDLGVLRQELKDSLAEAKRKALEQARKLAEEAGEDGRNRRRE